MKFDDDGRGEGDPPYSNAYESSASRRDRHSFLGGLELPAHATHQHWSWMVGVLRLARSWILS